MVIVHRFVRLPERSYTLSKLQMYPKIGDLFVVVINEA